MKIVHVSDLHTNDFVSLHPIEKAMKAIRPEFAIITGDIAEYLYWDDAMEAVGDYCRGDMFYVLGNHDYWGWDMIHKRSTLLRDFRYLHNRDAVSLSPHTTLVGVDGWYDTGFATEIPSPLKVADTFEIRDFQGRGPFVQTRMMKLMGEEQALSLQDKLIKALDHMGRNIIIATHVPPFAESLVHYADEEDMSAFMGSAAMGRVIRECADKNPSYNFTVLCGHTHRASDQYLTNNLRCIVSAGGDQISVYDCA